MNMRSHKIKIPSNFMRKSASMLVASSMLLTMWVCQTEGALYADNAQRHVNSVNAGNSSHEENPDAPPQHSHDSPHNDESTDVCCDQLFTKYKSAFRPLMVDGPVSSQLGIVIIGESHGNRGGSLVRMIDLSREPVEVHEANSYYFALPAHAPPPFS